MATVKIKYSENAPQEEFHRDITSPFLMFNGGLGCMREDSKVSTASGQVPICDITKQDFLLTLDENRGRFAYQTSSGAFLKGKDYFYRVISEHGEFLATSHHRTFSSRGIYQRVGDLCVGDEVYSCLKNPASSGLEHVQKSFLPSVLDSLNTVLGLLNHYARCIRQRDSQLLGEINTALNLSLLPTYAQEYGHIFCPKSAAHMDDQMEHLLKRSHLDLFGVHADKLGYILQLGELVLGEEGQVSSTSFEHIWQSSLKSLQSLDSSKIHPKALLSLIRHICAVLTCSTSNTDDYKLEKSKILAIEKQDEKEWVWDLTVPNTNNYVADGHVHHNSGKTYGLCMKLLKLSALNKNIAGGCMAPSFPMYKKDILPTFEDIFHKNGLTKHVKIHRSDHYIKFPWSRAPLYFFTAEKPIKGPNLGYGGINEHSSIPLERIQQFIQRIRVKAAPVRQLCFAGTPEDEYGWLDEFVERHTGSGDLRIINGKTTDNRYNADEYIEHLRSTLDPIAFRLFAEGEMLQLAGNNFYYAYSKKNHTDIEFDHNFEFFVNIDFNVGNMHATVSQQYGDEYGRKISVFVDEIVLKHSGADTYAMIDAIKAKFFGLTHNMLITCDASGRNRKTTGVSDVNALKNAFGKDAVRYRSSGNPRLRKRQLLCNGVIANLLVLVNPKKCPTLNKDLNKVLQKDDFTKDDKNKDLTHSSDTFDYYIDFEYKLETKESFNASRAR